MNNLIIDFFNKNELILENKKMLIAVSTGLDSMVLFNEALEAQKEVSFMIEVVHVDHQKREQSNLEKEYLQSYCRKVHIPLHVGVMPKENSGNFQEKAREFRYTFFKSVYQKTNADYLLLAHHLYDNIETVLIKFARNASLEAMQGMQAITTLKDMQVLRPFLSTELEVLVDTAKEKKVRFFEDESNFEEAYFRNQIRLQLLPKLKEVFPDLKQNFISFTSKLQLTNDVYYNTLRKEADTFVNSNPDKHIFSKAAFLHYKEVMQKEILFYLLKRHNLSSLQLEEVLKHIYSNKKNIMVDLFEKFTFVKEYDKITIFHNLIESNDVYLKIQDVGEYQIDNHRVICVSKKKNKNISNSHQLWYNYTMLPIVVRSKKDGDAILLSFGTKKVNDLLTDKKVGILERKKTLIIEDSNKQILSVLNYANSSLLNNVQEHDILIELKEKV